MNKTFLLAALGGVNKTAEALGIKPSSVSEWGEVIPDSALGRISRLRPDLLRLWWKQLEQPERRSGMGRRKSTGRRSADG